MRAGRQQEEHVQRLDVIAFGPHPDDAEAACGGLLAKLVRLGYRVAICDLTRGELASNGTPAEREAEARAAAGVLGVHARLSLGLADGGLRADDPEQQRLLVRLLRAHGPRLVIAPHEAARHPDHGQATALVRRAQFWCAVGRYEADAAPVGRPVLIRALDFGPMTPSFVVDIGAELETKLSALRCYRSQFERTVGSIPTVLNDPAWLRRIETDAHTYGQLVGLDAAEPYAVDGAVPLADPVAALAPAAVEVRR